MDSSLFNTWKNVEVFCIGGALVHNWSIGWCLEIQGFRALKRINVHLKFISILLSVSNA